MGKKLVLHNGILKTIRQVSEETGDSYHTVYQRYKADVEGKPKRKTKRRPVSWVDKNGVKRDFDSITQLAAFLGCSREWARKLVDKQEREGK